MSLLERLEKAEKELSWKVIQSRKTAYDYETDDLRKLVADAAKEIVDLESKINLVMEFDSNLIDHLKRTS